MMHPTNIDLAYPIFCIILSLILIFSPRTFMRGVKYDEESIKTETFFKRIGIGLLILSVGFGIYLYFKINA